MSPAETGGGSALLSRFGSSWKPVSFLSVVCLVPHVPHFRAFGCDSMAENAPPNPQVVLEFHPGVHMPEAAVGPRRKPWVGRVLFRLEAWRCWPLVS